MSTLVEHGRLVRSAGAAEYALELCSRIAACTETPGRVTRTFLSEPMHAVHALLREEMEGLGMEVRVDAIGNLRGVYAGREDGQRLLVGSHVDTVPDAGAFDGVLGVAVGLALVRSLGGRKLAYGVELIAFSEEEGVRFKLPFLGSRALIGELGAEEMARVDAEGCSVAEAVRAFGLDPGEMASSGIDAAEYLGFLEVHIEQGPVLEEMGLPVGVVEAIAGQTRMQVSFAGKANHAGTTPMGMRRDALAAAAEWVLEVERTAGETAGLVATVGSIEAMPGAANVIPGRAVLSLDVRHAQDAGRGLAVESLLEYGRRIAGRRGLGFEAKETSRQDAVPMDAGMQGALVRAVEAEGLTVHRMVSGAGHDAMVMARAMPAAMLFVRSPGGVSHHPEEAVLVEDVQAAIEVCLGFMEGLEGAFDG